MGGIDREKYMDEREVKILRDVTEERAIADLRCGRMGGVVTWCVVDVAMGTGSRASELARLPASSPNTPSMRKHVCLA